MARDRTLKLDSDGVARTRAFWIANKPGETAAPAFTPDAPVWWAVALALVVALLVQSSFAPMLAVRGATVSFITLLVAWYGVRTGVARGLAFGVIAGACLDALGGGTGAAWTLGTGLAGGLAGRLARTWLADTQLALVLCVAVVTLVRYATFGIVMAAQGHPLALPWIHIHAALWQAVLDAGVAYIALLVVPALGGIPAYRR